MPLYEFKCDNCGNFEKWLALADLGKLMGCPTCERDAKRVFSPPMLLTSSLRLQRQEQKEPEQVKRNIQPSQPQNKTAKGRPWMISH